MPVNAISIERESDPVRKAILAAMNRLLRHTPQRSTGRLSISQLAIEAGVKRWVLTHQHTDLKDLFQQQAGQQEARRSAALRSADEFEQLNRRHAELQAHCRFLQDRLDTYATALSLLAAENAALADRSNDAAKVQILPPRRPSHRP
ncbi:hypothetical protein KGQ19_01475 [Catenulispora sp. NL8]|uniref:Uncharacterized protein n=1 Tax=Catenulispora pinistramenti TaxID=2705254 RepID=A0ABS5KJM3_9ACTN|nr:hypothetical protein [Catenulispora pinistramenti]MBS2545531.1 hypothetical protein [Catenulispora pinistramenti]